MVTTCHHFLLVTRGCHPTGSGHSVVNSSKFVRRFRCKMETYSKKRTTAGTPHWMSPEVLLKSEYNKKTDIWSLGILLYELCEFKFPFEAESIPGLALKIMKFYYILNIHFIINVNIMFNIYFNIKFKRKI